MTNPPRLLLAAASLVLSPLGLRADDTAMADNPFYTASPLPFHYPPFDKIKESDYLPAFKAGVAEQLKNVDAIANNPEAPTFSNTIVALELDSPILDRVSAVFDDIKETESTPAIQQVEEETAPLLSETSDRIYQNPKLWARIKAVYDQRAGLHLDPESLRLVERYHRDFVRAGANLSDADKAKLTRLNSELAALQVTFTQNVLKERNADSLVVPSAAELAGLSADEIATARQAAANEKHPGEYVIPLKNTTDQPLMASLDDRAVRQRLMEKSLARGSHGGPYDNQATVVALARKRAEKAALLGYPTFSAYAVEIGTARTVDAVNHLLAQLVPAAVKKVTSDAADMQALIDQAHGGFQLASWDWAYYEQKVRQARYAFDDSQLKPYFELNHVLFDGVFYAAHRLYGITFKEVFNFPKYDPDLRVFQVYDADGQPLAILTEDFYARPTKKGGAWMNEFVEQNSLQGQQPVVGNHHNIPKPVAGQPTLLTFDEVTTLFHEFGHGLHGMFSRAKYPMFGGTNVARDFVEYPSQVNEMWAAWPEVVKNYARHYQTGAPMPQELLDKVIASQKFGQGFATLEYLKAVLIDQAWHTRPADQIPTDVAELENETFQKWGAQFPAIPPRYRSTYYSHIFAGDGYAANYFSYIWADVLVADSIDWFAKHGGLQRSSGDHFRATVLSHGGTVEAMDLFQQFTGHGPEVEPLLRKRGLE